MIKCNVTAVCDLLSRFRKDFVFLFNRCRDVSALQTETWVCLRHAHFPSCGFFYNSYLWSEVVQLLLRTDQIQTKRVSLQLWTTSPPELKPHCRPQEAVLSLCRAAYHWHRWWAVDMGISSQSVFTPSAAVSVWFALRCLIITRSLFSPHRCKVRCVKTTRH